MTTLPFSPRRLLGLLTAAATITACTSGVQADDLRAGPGDDTLAQPVLPAPDVDDARAVRRAAALEASTALEPVLIAPGGDPSQGGLTVVQGEQRFEMPLLDTEVEVHISGTVAVTEISQLFANPFDSAIEATYVFPLPDDGAVDDMTMRIGDREIIGEIHRREQARQMYEQARDNGQAAALLEQERPNIFTQSVANIMPGQPVEVLIRVVAPVGYEDGVYSYHFPMTVGPRFSPAGTADVGRITPPVASTGRSGHDIHLALDLDSGVPFYDLESTSHDIDIEEFGAHSAFVELAPHETIPNKDFALTWRAAGAEPAAALMSHRDEEGEGTFSLLLEPPAEFASDQVVPKELVFVLDCSCSMNGDPLDKAKELMRRALTDMNPHDTFQVIRFSEAASPMSAQPLANTPANVERGLAYVDGLSGMGGTQMIEGIRAALDYPHDDDRMRIVMFLTDGYIGNETQILGAIEEKLGPSRLFSLGLGSSPNRYLLERMAEVGAGTVQYALPHDDTHEVVSTFYDRIANPLLRDIEIDWGDIDVYDTTPHRIPDLFAGQPIQVYGRFADAGPTTVTVRGVLGTEPIEYRVPLNFGDPEQGHPGLPSMWARAQIRDRMALMYRDEDPTLKEEVVQISLDYRVMSQWTSFVAIERSISNPDGTSTPVVIPSELPAGMDEEFAADGIVATNMSSGRGMASQNLGLIGAVGGGAARPAPSRDMSRRREAERAPAVEAAARSADLDLAEAMEEGGEAAPVAQRLRPLRLTLSSGDQADRALFNALRRELQRLASQIGLDLPVGQQLDLEVVIGPDGSVRIRERGGLSSPALNQLLQQLQRSAVWQGQAPDTLSLRLRLE